MTGPVARYDVLVIELREKARNAARRNKPTMWAYYLEAAAGLEAWFTGVDRTDGAYAGAALALSDYAQGACPGLPPTRAADLWALGIYARRILTARGAGSGPRPSLAWLKDRAA